MTDNKSKSAPTHAGLFKPGKSGNPGGKPKNARNWLQVNFVRALAKDFETHGVRAIQRARTKDPMGYVRTIASLMPKQLEQTKPMEEFSDDELAAAIALIKSHIVETPAAGAATTH